ncbi:MAG: DUF4352 domain-containing protein [Anaerolineae bacterium]|nr:DUF4352 domain-containing protein [Anaerolineae bacterium]
MSIEPADEPTPETTSPAEESTASNSRFAGLGQNKPLLFGVGGVALAALGALFCVICILAILLVREWREEETATATPIPTPTALASLPTGQPQVQGVSNSGAISVTLGIPILLQFGGQEFDVLTDIVSGDGVWTPGASGEGQASWVSDTVINYVIGLPDTETNENLLTQLVPGDEIKLITNGRTSFTFAFYERTLVPATDRAVYAQQTPGVTLILLKSDGSDRLVVRGRAVAAEAPNTPEDVVSIGETAQLDNVQITADSAIYIADRPEIPSGFAYFQVDYTIQNVGLTALDTSLLQMTLVDQLGNRYALNPAATQSGNYPILNGFLNANQTVQATAGYQVPLGLNSETVNWVVANQDTGAQVFITLPFTGGETAVQGASIALFRAEVSSDLTSLQLGGQITNLGTQPLIITESDIQLTSPDGSVYLLLSTNPPLPWTVTSGQTLQFFVTYQRPPGGSAIFRLLNQEFQITEQP